MVSHADVGSAGRPAASETPKVPVDTPGLDLARLSAYLGVEHHELATGPLQARLIAGGRSNLTYEVTDGTRTYVLRRPPLGHVLETAHDMSREYEVITALGPTDVPVPGGLALCADSGVLGAPFYLMERIEGTPYRYSGQLRELGPERTRKICDAMVDALSALHRIRPEDVGLSGFGHPGGYLGRQVRRWSKQLGMSRSRPLAGADHLYRLLRDSIPEDGSAALVHGDFRLDNLLINEAGGVAAVIDWEMATLGDPLTDLALLVMYQRLPALGRCEAVSDASLAPGYSTPEEIMERYRELNPQDLRNWSFYLGLAAFKLAAILEGLYYRDLIGRSIGPEFVAVGSLVEPMIAVGIDEMAKGIAS